VQAEYKWKPFLRKMGALPEKKKAAGMAAFSFIVPGFR
jgi:hypothetical protein